MNNTNPKGAEHDGSFKQTFGYACDDEFEVCDKCQIQFLVEDLTKHPDYDDVFYCEKCHE